MSDKRITELEAEIERLKAELERSSERERELEETRAAMLFMMEDLNGFTSKVSHAKMEWEATFDAISSPIFIHDENYSVIRANRAYAEAAGIAFQEMLGKPYFRVFPRMEGPFESCLNLVEGRKTNGEEFVKAEGKIYKLTLYPVMTAEGEYLYSVHLMEDVTEKKAAEEALKAEVETTSHLLMIAEATAGTTDIDKLMTEVVHCCHKITGCETCLSYLWNREQRLFQPSQSFGLSHGMLPWFKTEVLKADLEFVKKAFADKRPLIIREESLLQQYFNWIGDISSLAVIPLIGKKDHQGLILGIYRGESAPDIAERDVKVMRGISHQVSVALEEAGLYKESIDRAMELSRKIETIQVMNEIDRSILSTLEPSEILESVMRLVSKVIACDRSTIAIADRDRQGFVLMAGFGIDSISKGTLISFCDTNATEVLETRRPQYIANCSDIRDPRPLETTLLNAGFLSHIRTPLVVKDEVAGVLSVGSKRVAAFTPEDLSTLEKLAFQIGVALQNARQVSDLEDLFLGTVKSLSAAIDAKSPWTAGHSERVTRYALEIGKEMGLNNMDLRDLELAGLLHDTGKIGVPGEILEKPGKLTDEEMMVMRQHPLKGAEIVAPIRQMKEVIPAIKCHHEYYNGTGYPGGLSGDEIPLFSRILAVADTADAMGADRPYRKGRGMDVIVSELQRCSGTQFDPKVVEVFLRVVSEGRPIE